MHRCSHHLHAIGTSLAGALMLGCADAPSAPFVAGGVRGPLLDATAAPGTAFEGYIYGCRKTLGLAAP